MLLLCEFFNNMRTDKAGPAGYNILHDTILDKLPDLHQVIEEATGEFQCKKSYQSAIYGKIIN